MTAQLIATVVIIGDNERLAAAAEALKQLGAADGVRVILISEGENTAPAARETGNAIAIDGLAPRFLNNAVAGLRLSSLPSVVWWRGGSLDNLAGLAKLADRMILDARDPEPGWRHAARLVERTALSDLRWTQLTRWRSAIAHLFDLSQVRDALGTFHTLTIDAIDPHAARLYAGWLRSSLRWGPEVSIAISAARKPTKGHVETPLERVRLEGTGVAITTQRNTKDCLIASVDGHDTSARVVPLGDGTLNGLIAEELGIRTRDVAFEHALASALEIRA